MPIKTATWEKVMKFGDFREEAANMPAGQYRVRCTDTNFNSSKPILHIELEVVEGENAGRFGSDSLFLEEITSRNYKSMLRKMRQMSDAFGVPMPSGKDADNSEESGLNAWAESLVDKECSCTVEMNAKGYPKFTYLEG